MIRQDLQLNNNDLVILNNDLVWADSDDQHIADMINAFPGHWKQFPQNGVGVFTYLRSKGTQNEINRKIQLSLTADGYMSSNASAIFDPDGNLVINASATR